MVKLNSHLCLYSCNISRRDLKVCAILGFSVKFRMYYVLEYLNDKSNNGLKLRIE